MKSFKQFYESKQDKRQILEKKKWELIGQFADNLGYDRVKELQWIDSPWRQSSNQEYAVFATRPNTLNWTNGGDLYTITDEVTKEYNNQYFAIIIERDLYFTGDDTYTLTKLIYTFPGSVYYENGIINDRLMGLLIPIDLLSVKIDTMYTDTKPLIAEYDHQVQQLQQQLGTDDLSDMRGILDI